MSTGKYFMQRSSLEDGRYTCSYCSQKYPTQRDLGIHEYLHGNYSIEAIFDLAVQPRISYMTYEYFTYECRGIVSGVFGKEYGCAETPEQDYEDEKNTSYNGNNELYSTSRSPIHINQRKRRPNIKFHSQRLMKNAMPSNQPPSPSYTPPVQPPSPSYTPSVQPPSPSYTPSVQPPSPSYTPPVQPPRLNYTPPVQPPSLSYPPTVQPTSSSYTPPLQPPSSSYTPHVQPPSSSFTPPVHPPSSSFTPPVHPPSSSYTPPVQPLGPNYKPTNPPTRKSRLIPLLHPQNAHKYRKPSRELVKTKHNEQTADGVKADLSTKCQTSFLSSTGDKSNPKTFCNEMNRSIPSCRTEQGFTNGSGSKGNSPWIS